MNGLEEKISYQFKNKELLEEALTHPSLSRAGKIRKNYERLEFLGDSVLSLSVAEMLYRHYPNEAEGELAKRRAQLVGRDTVSKGALKIGLDKYLHLADGEENIGGRANPANLENAMEALLGAIFIDGGISPAKTLIENLWSEELVKMIEPPSSPKSELQEYMQKLGKSLPEYNIIGTSGPSHKPEFTIEVKVSGHKPETGTASSRKAAENIAADNMLKKLRR